MFQGRIRTKSGFVSRSCQDDKSEYANPEDTCPACGVSVDGVAYQVRLYAAVVKECVSFCRRAVPGDLFARFSAPASNSRKSCFIFSAFFSDPAYVSFLSSPEVFSARAPGLRRPFSRTLWNHHAPRKCAANRHGSAVLPRQKWQARIPRTAE